MDLISSLFNVASSRDVPFHQPLQLQCLHHGSTKAYLCSPFVLIHSKVSFHFYEGGLLVIYKGSNN